MTRAKISELKSKLSAYIARARRGDVTIILDRETPVAKLVPFDEAASDLRIEPATARPGDLRRPSKVKLDKRVDTTALLREDRDGR